LKLRDLCRTKVRASLSQLPHSDRESLALIERALPHTEIFKRVRIRSKEIKAPLSVIREQRELLVSIYCGFFRNGRGRGGLTRYHRRGSG
jgi:hypothetical protein